MYLYEEQFGARRALLMLDRCFESFANRTTLTKVFLANLTSLQLPSIFRTWFLF